MMNDIVSIGESILERMASEEQAQIEAFSWAACYALLLWPMCPSARRISASVVKFFNGSINLLRVFLIFM